MPSQLWDDLKKQDGGTDTDILYLLIDSCSQALCSGSRISYPAPKYTEIRSQKPPVQWKRLCLLCKLSWIRRASEDKNLLKHLFCKMNLSSYFTWNTLLTERIKQGLLSFIHLIILQATSQFLHSLHHMHFRYATTVTEIFLSQLSGDIHVAIAVACRARRNHQVTKTPPCQQVNTNCPGAYTLRCRSY